MTGKNEAQKKLEALRSLRKVISELPEDCQPVKVLFDVEKQGDGTYTLTTNEAYQDILKRITERDDVDPMTVSETFAESLVEYVSDKKKGQEEDDE